MKMKRTKRDRAIKRKKAIAKKPKKKHSRRPSLKSKLTKVKKLLRIMRRR